MRYFLRCWCLLTVFVLPIVAADPSIIPAEVMAEVGIQAAERPFKKELIEGSGATADDASLLLVVLGAGYDHKTPNTYKQSVAKGLQRIFALDPASLDLPVLALATSALTEAYAMTNDLALRPHAERFLGSLRTRWPGELSRWLGRSGAFAGPETVVLIVRALHSSLAGGLEVGDDLKTLRALDLGQGEVAELARAYLSASDVDKPPYTDLATTQRWVASFDRWWKTGHTELIVMATFVVFRNGGSECQLLYENWRNRLVALQIHGGPDDGRWSLEHHPLGKLYGTTQAMFCMEIFYRATESKAAKPTPMEKQSVAPGNF